jgi:hypothetical protein
MNEMRRNDVDKSSKAGTIKKRKERKAENIVESN